MSAQHTPTPWADATPSMMVTSATGKTVAMVYGDDPACVADDRARANAAFIVRACNAHDHLVAALERTLSWLSSYPAEAALGKEGPYEQARAALAKVQS